MPNLEDNVCELIPYITLETPDIDDFTRSTLEAGQRGWVFGGGYNPATGEIFGTFQVSSERAAYMPGLHEVFLQLPDPVQNDEFIRVDNDEIVGTLVVYEGFVGDTFHELCRRLFDLKPPVAEGTNAKVLNFPAPS